MSRLSMLAALALATCGSTSHAAVIVNLDPATAFTTVTTTAGGTGANTNTLQPNPTITQGNGLTANYTLTPAAGDLAGTVLIAEIGGTSNGTGIYLVNGVPTLISKPSAGNANVVPASLNDNDLADKTLALQAGAAPLAAATSYSLAVVFDLVGQKAQLAYTADGSNFTNNSYTLLNTTGATNWNGNNSVSVAANSIRQEAALPQTGFRGGLSEDVNAGLFYAGLSTDGTGGAKDFTGTISQGALWNVVGTIQVPEPTSLGLLITGVAASTLRRRRRA